VYANEVPHLPGHFVGVHRPARAVSRMRRLVDPGRTRGPHRRYTAAGGDTLSCAVQSVA